MAGDGAVETEIAKELRDYAAKVGGREQLAIEAFTDAIEIIPRTLTWCAKTPAKTLSFYNVFSEIGSLSINRLLTAIRIYVCRLDVS